MGEPFENSDHQIIRFQVNYYKDIKNIKRYDYFKANYQDIRNYSRNISWFFEASSHDATSVWNDIKNSLTDIRSNFIKLKSVH